MASETILSKWQALFPNNSPESNANAVNGQGVDGSGNLVNAVKSPFRETTGVKAVNKAFFFNSLEIKKNEYNRCEGWTIQLWILQVSSSFFFFENNVPTNPTISFELADFIT